MSLIVSTILSDPLEDLLELFGLNSSLTSLEGLRDVKAESYSLEAFLDELSESCEEWVLVILLSPSVLKKDILFSLKKPEIFRKISGTFSI